MINLLEIIDCPLEVIRYMMCKIYLSKFGGSMGYGGMEGWREKEEEERGAHETRTA